MLYGEVCDILSAFKVAKGSRAARVDHSYGRYKLHRRCTRLDELDTYALIA
jgi:hypothetical protein